jgi:hypothetical protein
MKQFMFVPLDDLAILQIYHIYKAKLNLTFRVFCIRINLLVEERTNMPRKRKEANILEQPRVKVATLQAEIERLRHQVATQSETMAIQVADLDQQRARNRELIVKLFDLERELSSANAQRGRLIEERRILFRVVENYQSKKV